MTLPPTDTPWTVPAGEEPFVHDGERWQYVRCIDRGREVTGYLRAADDFVYDDFRAPRNLAL